MQLDLEKLLAVVACSIDSRWRRIGARPRWRIGALVARTGKSVGASQRRPSEEQERRVSSVYGRTNTTRTQAWLLEEYRGERRASHQGPWGFTGSLELVSDRQTRRSGRRLVEGKLLVAFLVWRGSKAANRTEARLLRLGFGGGTGAAADEQDEARADLSDARGRSRIYLWRAQGLVLLFGLGWTRLK
jgi:hypothetical protein